MKSKLKAITFFIVEYIGLAITWLLYYQYRIKTAIFKQNQPVYSKFVFDRENILKNEVKTFVAILFSFGLYLLIGKYVLILIYLISVYWIIQLFRFKRKKK